MSSRKLPATISSVRTSFATFFERVMVLYNLTFQKEEKDHKVEDVKRFTLELYQSGHINDYIKETINDTVEKFALLHPVALKKRYVDLDYLDAFISLNIDDINSEIGELIHWWLAPIIGGFYSGIVILLSSMNATPSFAYIQAKLFMNLTSFS